MISESCYISADDRPEDGEVGGIREKQCWKLSGEMKMITGGSSGEAEKSGGGTVVVGVKLDSQSRELLTWALVKVAQPGDCVIALHVLGHNGKHGLIMIFFFF